LRSRRVSSRRGCDARRLPAAIIPRIALALTRSLRLPHATALVVGTIVGASVFVQASELTSHVPDIPILLTAWALCGVLTLFGALVSAELASAFPRTGGVYVFLREIYAPAAGFLWGWAMFWVMHSGIIAAMAVVFARYAAFFFHYGDTGIRIVAVGVIAALSAMNCLGVRLGSTVQTLCTWAKIVAIAAVVAAAFAAGSAVPEHFAYGTRAGPAPVSAHDFLLALIAGLFAFGGWHVVTYTAEETVEPERTIPRALAIGIGVVTICYIALNAAYFYVLPVDRVMASTRVAADAATVLFGQPGGAAISALVIFSVFGAMTGSILAAPRVYFAMAGDGLAFRWIDHVHPRFRTPDRAILLQGAWASVLVWTGTYRQLFTRVIFTEWIFFAMMAAGIFLLRRRPGYAPAYRVWGYPWTPAVFAVASAAIVVNRILSEPIDSALGLALVAAGVPAYAWSKSRRVRSLNESANASMTQ
jgi:APA family basic amino acid/polyamine antiporter